MCFFYLFLILLCLWFFDSNNCSSNYHNCYTYKYHCCNYRNLSFKYNHNDSYNHHSYKYYNRWGNHNKAVDFQICWRDIYEWLARFIIFSVYYSSYANKVDGMSWRYFSFKREILVNCRLPNVSHDNYLVTILLHFLLSASKFPIRVDGDCKIIHVSKFLYLTIGVLVSV